MSICELCGDFVERPNVIAGKVVCHLCTIRQLRIRDNTPMAHPTLGIPVKPDGSVFIPTWRNGKGHWTKGSDNGHGYLCVKFRGKKYKVHRLVLEAFVGPCPEGMECDHIDRDKLNNHVSNLRWTDRTGNNRNTRKQDRVEARGLPHTFENKQAYSRGSCKLYYHSHHDAILEKKKEYRKINKLVLFADGKPHWVSRPAATELLKLPRRFRIF